MLDSAAVSFSFSLRAVYRLAIAQRMECLQIRRLVVWLLAMFIVLLGFYDRGECELCVAVRVSNCIDFGVNVAREKAIPLSNSSCSAWSHSYCYICALSSFSFS